MVKHDTPFAPDRLEADICQLLAEHQETVEIPLALRTRMRANLLQKVATVASIQANDLQTLRAQEGQWQEVATGVYIKILHRHEPAGLLTYLVRLAPGFAMAGHPHPFAEECFMLEGELWLGDLKLQAGDYHFAAQGSSHGHLHTPTGALAFIKGALPS